MPAKFHQESAPLRPTATYTRPAWPASADGCESPYPQVTANHSHSLKQRQLTLFYRLLPQTCRIRAKA
ncbi:hypothetical protein CDS [Bradyrhizobium sp.]|nr:hypothetical protein CDS [Bradyrhizobium sp.]